MSKEVRILSIIVTVSFLFGVAGTTISIVNNHLIRRKAIETGKLFMLEKAFSQRPWKARRIPQINRRRVLQSQGARIPSRRRIQNFKKSPLRRELSQRLEKLAKGKAEKERKLFQTLKEINRQIKEQGKAINRLSRRLEKLNKESGKSE